MIIKLLIYIYIYYFIHNFAKSFPKLGYSVFAIIDYLIIVQFLSIFKGFTSFSSVGFSNNILKSLSSCILYRSHASDCMVICNYLYTTENQLAPLLGLIQLTISSICKYFIDQGIKLLLLWVSCNLSPDHYVKLTWNIIF